MKTIRECETTPIITEIKFESPSAGKIREIESSLSIAEAMVDGGACAISVLTDPENFAGSLENLALVSGKVPVPVVMKDIIVSPRQLQAAARAGASAVVLISEVFTRGFSEVPLDSLISEAQRLKLEVLVEANSGEEFAIVRKYRPNIYGINNRNLSTLQVDLSTTETILAKNPNLDRPVISESGIEAPKDIRRLKPAGVTAFLIGTSIMKSHDVESKVRELVNA